MFFSVKHVFPFFFATFLPSRSHFNRELLKRKTQSKKRNDSWKFSRFPLFFATFLPGRSHFYRKLCERKTQSKESNSSRKIACFFFGENFYDFPFFSQRFYPVDHVLIANYASVKHNQKSAMTAGKSHVF